MERYAPASEQQARAFIQWAIADHQSMALQGKNSKRQFGLAMTTDCALSTAGLRGILEYHPEELIMTALPGTPIEEIKKTLAAHHQHLEFEPLSLNKLYGMDDEGTIGGVFIGNLAGPRRIKSGAARDHILGIRAINGRGQVFKSGGKVIKNVSGYDMSKLIAGSWGTLSLLTELSFKVLPAPITQTSIALWGLSADQGVKLLTTVLCAPYEASGLAFLPEQTTAALKHDDIALLDGSLTLIRLEGTALSVRERVKAIKTVLPDDHENSLFANDHSLVLWSLIRDIAPLGDDNRTPCVLRISIPPNCAPALAQYIDELGGCLWYLDGAGSWLWVGVCDVAAQEKLHAIRREVQKTTGSVILYRAPEAIKKAVGIYAFADQNIRKLNERIKHSFDPLNLFNPDRLYSL